MSGALYVTARKGGRPSRTALENAWNHFVSTGAMVGSPELAAEIATKALDKKWAVSLNEANPGVVTVRRIFGAGQYGA
jgi:hypothetical protein